MVRAGPLTTCWYWPLALIEASCTPLTFTLVTRRLLGGLLMFAGSTSLGTIGPDTTVTAQPGFQVCADLGARYSRANAWSWEKLALAARHPDTICSGRQPLPGAA